MKKSSLPIWKDDTTNEIYKIDQMSNMAYLLSQTRKVMSFPT